MVYTPKRYRAENGYPVRVEYTRDVRGQRDRDVQ